MNTVSVGLAADDNEKVLGQIPEVAKLMGIESKLDTNMAIALGSSVVTPLELTNAYATIAAGGIAMKPRFVDAVDGKAIKQEVGTQAIPAEVAYVMANMLEAVTTEGTAAEAGEKLKIPIAGKTGTSQEARDTWFIGMTPDYVIGVWVGYDDNRPQPGEQGARVALPVFISVAKSMKLPSKQFAKPPHVVEVTIDKASGLLAAEGAPKGTTLLEAFVEGTEPTATATKAGDVDEQHAVTSEYGNGD
jgi:penicillin-binding protein 1A